MASWDILGIDKKVLFEQVEYQLIDAKQFNDIFWSVKNGDIVKFIKNGRTIELKIMSESYSLDSNYKNPIYESYKRDIINSIEKDGFKILRFNYSDIENEVIQEFIKSDDYELSISDNQFVNQTIILRRKNARKR